jgi:hypothetical protein
LKEPVADELVPNIGENVAVYSTGRYSYAFSGYNCQWDVLELPQGEEAHPFIGVNNIVTVEHGNHLAVFNPKFGKWEDFDTKAEPSQ